jgi:DNA polymerase III epsilon subunit-like protein
MSLKIKNREKKLLAAVSQYGQDSHETFVALARLEKAREEYDATAEGLKKLKILTDENPEDEDVKKRFLLANASRIMQVNALKEVRNGRTSNLATIISNLKDFYDKEEAESIIESSREFVEKYALRSNLEKLEYIQNEDKYSEYVNSLEDALKSKYNGVIPANCQKALDSLRSLEAPDAINEKAYARLPEAFDRSREQLINEIKTASALQGVDEKIAAEYYEAYREQYKNVYSNLPEVERPDPPASWLRGEFSWSGYAKDPSSSFAPHDKASLYAIYRLRADDKAIPDYVKQSRSVASIDLETAGPPGREGFSPEHGRIIEVGIQIYTPSGKKVGQVDQLVRPEESFLKTYGTGAEHIHQIKVSDLDGKPEWKNIAPQISSALNGKILLAQNAGFESRWLKHYLSDYDKTTPTLDTMEISRKHFDLPNHKLNTICDANGVNYTNGHRALHDAGVTAQAYFKQRRSIQKVWASKPSRRKAEPVIKLLSSSRWSKKRSTHIPH